MGLAVGRPSGSSRCRPRILGVALDYLAAAYTTSVSAMTVACREERLKWTGLALLSAGWACWHCSWCSTGELSQEQGDSS